MSKRDIPDDFRLRLEVHYTIEAGTELDVDAAQARQMQAAGIDLGNRDAVLAWLRNEGWFSPFSDATDQSVGSMYVESESLYAEAYNWGSGGVDDYFGWVEDGRPE